MSDLEVRFEDLEGMPFIENAPAHFSCRIKEVPYAGDHLIFIGETT